MLLAYNSKNNSLDTLLELNNTIINTRPYIINDTDILWGKYIIRPSNRTIIDLLNDTRFNDYNMTASFLYRNRIYIEVYINESFKFIVFNDENYRILDVYELDTTHIDDLFIINSKYYGFSLDYIVDNGSKTINFKLYMVKQNLLDLCEIFNISGSSLGFGYDKYFIYLFVDNTLWFIDPINQIKASIWINVSKLSKPFTDIIVLGSNYHEKTLIILDKDKLVYVVLSLEDTIRSVDQMKYLPTLLLTMLLILLMLRNSKRSIRR